jgi:hypothetical protein
MVYVALLLGASALVVSLLRGRTSGATRR